MRAGPINLAALGTSPEFLVILLGQRLQAIDDLRFVDRLEKGVAAETARKWSQSRAEVEPAQDFEGLFKRVLRPEIVAVPDNRMHQQAPISGEEGAVFIARDAHQLSIIGRRIVNDIDAEQAQIPDKLSQMSIGNKLSDVAHLQPIFCERSNSLRLDWIDINDQFAANYEAKIHRLTINQDQIDFSVWDAAGFNHVFDRSFLG